MRWITHPASAPPSDYLAGTPISMPLIGLAQLAHFASIMDLGGLTPASLMRRVSAVSG